MFLNVGRTHDVTDNSSSYGVTDTAALYSGVTELRPRPRRQVSWNYRGFLTTFGKRVSMLKILYQPHLLTSFLINYLIFILAVGSADSELLTSSTNELPLHYIALVFPKMVTL